VYVVDVRRSIARIVFSFAALPLPFFGGVGTLLCMLLLCLIIAVINPKMHTFMMFATISDRKSEVLIKPLALTLSLTALSVLTVISSLPLFIIPQIIIIATLGEVTSNIVGPYGKLAGSLTYIIIGGFFAYVVGAFAASVTSVDISYDLVLFLAMIGAIVGALLKSVTTAVEEDVVVPIGMGMVMWLLASFKYSIPTVQLLLTLLFMMLLGYSLGKIKLADLSGVLSGILMGLLIVSFTDFRWFLIILAFFILSGAFTKYKYDYKRALGIAQGAGGARGYKNVFGNGLAALIFAIAFGITGNPLFLVAYLGAVATAAGDTLASEIGQTYKKLPRLITDLTKVPHGTDGGITILGEFAALGGAAAIAIVSALLGLGSLGIMIPIILGGFFGVNFDSVLGAVFERKHCLTNSSVNFFATVSGAIASVIVFLLLR
jgi:uncharacterized protein (TIGR00297 family)